MEQHARHSPVIVLTVYDGRSLGLLDYVSHKLGIKTDIRFHMIGIRYLLYPEHWTDLFPFFKNLFKEECGRNCYSRLSEKNYQEFDRACTVFSMSDMYPTDIIRRQK